MVVVPSPQEVPRQRIEPVLEVLNRSPGDPSVGRETVCGVAVLTEESVRHYLRRQSQIVGRIIFPKEYQLWTKFTSNT